LEENNSNNGNLEKNRNKSSSEELSRLRPRNKLKPAERYEVNLTEFKTPQTYEEAVTCAEAEQWNDSIKKELNAHELNKTWELVPNREEKQRR